VAEVEVEVVAASAAAAVEVHVVEAVAPEVVGAEVPGAGPR